MQHLNLFSQLDRVKEPPFSARQQLQLIAIAVGVMLLVYGWLLMGDSSLSKELSAKQQQQRVLSESISQLQAEKDRQLRDSRLAQEIERLKKDVDFRRQLLATVEPDRQADVEGFAIHLQGLARQHIEGMWFTDIELLRGGQELALSGKTRIPELVPRYLQGLSAESAFNGHQFKIFRMHSEPQAGNVLHFELRAKEQGEPDRVAGRPVAGNQ